MRIVNRKDFLDLSSGTIYAKYRSFGNFSEISIKYDTQYDNDGIGMDWLYMELNYFFPGQNSNDLFEKCEQMEKDGSDCPLELDSFMRDGLFELDRLFAVYSKHDVQLMISKLQESISNL